MDGFTGFSQNQVALIVLLGLLPFLMIAVTSFIKFAVVISLLRNALGIQQIPPNIVIYSIALVMSEKTLETPLAARMDDAWGHDFSHTSFL